jgi:hypothetical protein
LEEIKSPSSTLAPPFLLRRQRDEENGGSRPSSIMGRKKKSKKWDDGLGPGGPVSQSAIFPQRQSDLAQPVEIDEKETSPSHDNTDSTLAPQDSLKHKDPEKIESEESPAESSGQASPNKEHVAVYDEGDNMIFENSDGEVLDVQPVSHAEHEKLHGSALPDVVKAEADKFWTLGGFRRKMSEVYSVEMEKRKEKGKSERKHEPARAYQFGNTVCLDALRC